jgi:hypothetical protein
MHGSRKIIKSKRELLQMQLPVQNALTAARDDSLLRAVDFNNDHFPAFAPADSLVWK